MIANADITPTQLYIRIALSALSISSLSVLFSFTYNLQHFNELKRFVAVKPLDPTRTTIVIGSRLFWTDLQYNAVKTGIVAALNQTTYFHG